LLVAIFQLNVMIGQTIITKSQQKTNIDLKLNLLKNQENRFYINKSIFLEKNENKLAINN
jgi:hypothetical protein